MKKIKDMGQLKSRKKHLRERQGELEKTIKKDWQELKEKLRPRAIAKEAFGEWIDKKEQSTRNGENILSSTLSYGASLLAKKIAAKAGDKWDAWFKNPKL